MVWTLWSQALLVLAPFLVKAQDSTTITSSQSSTAIPSAQFTVPASADVGATLIPNIYDPEAKLAQEECPGYTASQISTSSTGLQARLSLAGDACNLYGTDVNELNLLVEYHTDTRLHVSIQPAHIGSDNESWYILPSEYVPVATQGNGSNQTSELSFSWDNNAMSGFTFNVTSKSSGEVLFSTTDSKLVYEDQFIEFVTSQPDDYNLYGLGEVIHELRLGNNFTRTIYAADVGDPIDRNLYGSHPFYLQTRYYEQGDTGPVLVGDSSMLDQAGNYSSYTHGVYLRNAHGQEILMNANNVTWRTLGGSIDLYFFSGPTQRETTQQYLDVVGRPAMQQYWGFGYHQCRWGYQNWSVTEDVVNTYEKFGIPLETIWNDIDYMRGYRDFENDQSRFPYEEGAAFLERLHDSGRHYIPIIDAAIYIPNPDNESDAYQPFTTGNQSDVWLLNPDDTTYIGAVWPGYTVFPDWLKNETHDWWTGEVMSYYSKIPIDGAWIDMNEVSSFCVGSCGTGNLSLNPVHPSFKLNGEPGNIVYDYPEGFNLTNATEAAAASSSSSSQAAAQSTSDSAASSISTSYLRTTPTAGVRNVDHPPYVINHVQEGADLAVHAVAPNATHHNGVQEYDVHNLYGHMILQSTYRALLAAMPGKRPFIIGRSTFPGSGNYTGHWGGDNASKWYYMYFSIPQALSFSLFGVPMFGVDTCGFNGNSDEELCNRWMQLSAFFPFYRNHNTLAANSQEAYVWASVAEATRTAMAIRFQLLPYLYTLFYNAHENGDTVMRALAWEFPNDPSLAAADRQFFLGPAILVTPVLVQGDDSVDGVFPGLREGTDFYYDWYNHSQIAAPAERNTTIDAPLGHIPVYIRGGYVLAMQHPAMTTRDARKTGWSILIALGADGSATGSVYLDDGESLEQNATKLVRFAAQSTQESRVTLQVVVEGDYDGLDTPLQEITVLGLQRPFSTLTINDQQAGQVSWNKTSGSVMVTDLTGSLGGKAWGRSFNVSIS
jgi:alpha-glucosidase